MAIGTDIIKTSGRLIFDLVRDGERTSRTLEFPNPVTDLEALQISVNRADSIYTSGEQGMNLLMQPANWRDTNVVEEQWTTVGVHYEVVQTAITPIEPDEAPTVAGGRSEEAQADERSQQDEGQPQGQWQG